jgi:hypothetical protein
VADFNMAVLEAGAKAESGLREFVARVRGAKVPALFISPAGIAARLDAPAPVQTSGARPVEREPRLTPYRHGSCRRSARRSLQPAPRLGRPDLCRPGAAGCVGCTLKSASAARVLVCRA